MVKRPDRARIDVGERAPTGREWEVFVQEAGADRRRPNTFGTVPLLAASLRSRVATNDPTTVERDPDAATTVDVRCIGHVRTAIGEHEMDFTVEGDTLRAFLEAFFEVYGVEDPVIAGTEAEATAHGWAPTDGDPPGTREKIPRANGPAPSRASRSTIRSTNTSTVSTRNSRTATGSR